MKMNKKHGLLFLFAVLMCFSLTLTGVFGASPAADSGANSSEPAFAVGSSTALPDLFEGVGTEGLTLGDNGLKAAGGSNTVLAFTSDVHFATYNDSETRLRTFLTALNRDYDYVDAVAFGGDMSDTHGGLTTGGSVTRGEYWNNAQTVRDIVSEYGSHLGAVVYTTGNHEYKDGKFGQYSDAPPSGQYYQQDELSVSGSKYVIYSMGAVSQNQEFTNDQIEKLNDENYGLPSISSDKTIIVIAHYPLHYVSSRTTANAKSVIDTLNDLATGGKKIVFLWGHNHSVATANDPFYDKVFKPGDSLQYASGSNNTETIRFYYAASGCMTDSDYNTTNNTGAAGNVTGKGLVIEIGSDDLLTFNYYDKSGEVFYTFTEPDPNVVTGISIDQESAAVNIGDTVQLSASVQPSTATGYAVTWSSSDDVVATVDETGLVTGVSEGTATITVTVDTGTKSLISDSIDVTVKSVEGGSTTKYIYVRTDSMTSGNTYLIAGSQTVGASTNLLSHNQNQLSTDAVPTIHAASENENANNVWIDGDDVDDTSLWTMTTVSNRDKLINNGYYITFNNNNTLTISNTGTTYDRYSATYPQNNNIRYLQFSGGSTNRYIQYSNNTFSYANSRPGTNNTVYLYIQVSVEVCDHEYFCPGFEWHVSDSAESAAATARFVCKHCNLPVEVNANVSREEIPVTCEDPAKWKFTATATDPNGVTLTETKTVAQKVSAEEPGTTTTTVYVPATTLSTDKSYVLVNSDQTGSVHAIANGSPNPYSGQSGYGSGYDPKDVIVTIQEGIVTPESGSDPYHGKYIVIDNQADAEDAVWTPTNVAGEGTYFSNGGLDLFHNSQYLYLDTNGQDHYKCWKVDFDNGYIKYERGSSAGAYRYLTYEAGANNGVGWCTRKDDGGDVYGHVYLFETVTATIWVPTYHDAEPLGHDFGEWTQTTAPTCTEAGEETRTCARCGETETQEVEALGHEFGDGSFTEAKAPSCTEDGNIAYYTCDRCEKHFATADTSPTATALDDVTIPAINHAWGEASYEWSVDNSTCTATRVCANDASHTETEEVDTTSTVKTNPTCTDKGTTTYTATFENEAFATQTKDVEDIAAIGHDWDTPTYVWSEDKSEVKATRVCKNDGNHKETETVGSTSEVTTAATCEGAGVRTYTSAAFENEAFAVQTTTEEIAAIGHDYQAAVTEPTCTAQGYTTHTCSRCNDSYVDTYVDALGHAWGEWIVKTEPTCTAKGEETRTCSRCNETETREVDALGHTLTKTDKMDATCTEAGTEAYWTCSVCGKMFSDENGENEITAPATIAALGHNFGEWKLTTEPTCTAKGEETRTCSRCNETETREVDALGHDYIAVVTEPTCTAQGYTTHTCSRCNDSYVDTYVDALGHDWGEWTQTKVPTCTEAGEDTRTCSRCDAFEMQAVAALGHDMTAHEAVAATCTEPGNSAYWSCDRCKKFFSDVEGENEIDENSWVINATGHTWGEPTYGWSDDYSKVIAIHICTKDATHIEAETVTASSETTDPTCEAAGKTVYTSAEFTNNAFEVQIKEVEIPALGHDYQEVENSSAAATCTTTGKEADQKCGRCGNVITGETIPALGHDYQTVVTDPTCTEGGYTTYTCSRCGDSYTADETEALGHDFGEWKVTTEPTCTEKGVETRICSRCDAAETREVAVLGHTEEIIPAVAATCTETGLTEGKKCSVCGEILVAQEEVAALGHDFGEWTQTKAPTCTEAGEETRTCSRCGEIETRAVEATGHNWGETTYTWSDDYSKVIAIRVCKRDVTHIEAETADTTSEITKPAGCVTKGETTYTATFENQAFEEQTKTIANIDALGHTPGETVQENFVDATCSAEGSYDEVVYCTVCSEELSREAKTTEKAAHTEEVIPAVAATCTESGLTEGKKCSVCGEILAAQEEVAKLGHTEEIIPAVAATCTETGLTEGKKCSVCGEILVAQEEVAKLGHTEEIIPVVAATCTETGLTEGKKCSVCGEILVAQEEVAALGHDFGEWKVTTESTCTEVGEETRTCSRCEAFETRDLEALGHDYQTVVTDPTCTEGGYTTYTCSRCGDSYTADETEALSHDFGEWTETKAPTCTEAGEDTRTCSRCGETETRTVEATGHDWGEPTYTWSEDYSKVIAIRICATDPKHIEAETVTASSATTDPTCTETGKTVYTGAAFDNPDFKVQTKEVVIEALGHAYGDWELTTNPTCTEKGVETRTCSRCDATETRDVEALGHDYQAVVTGPTCTEGGYTTYTCSRCDDSYTADETAALDHNWKFTEFTWSEDNKAVANYQCQNDTSHIETVSAEMTAETTDATCTEAGTVVYTATVSAEKSLDGTAHTEKKTVSDTALGHDWGEPTYTWSDDYSKVIAIRICANDPKHIEAETVTASSATTDPTCEGKGKTVYTSVAFENSAFEVQTKEVEIPALGHDFGEWTLTKAPTCTEAGEETRYCSRCDAFETRDVEALGHDYQAEVTEPTCTEGGYTTYTCSRCDDSYKADETAALGHDFGEWTQTKAPTCTETGEKTRTCSRCDVFETQEVPAAGHTPGETVRENEVPATCTAEGSFDEVAYCSVCEAELSRETKTIPAAGHSYGEPAFRWNEDMSADLIVSCIEGDDERITPAEVTSEAGTGEDEGYTIYTAKATYDGKEYREDKKVENDKIPVASVTLNKDALILTEGDSDILTVTIEPADATDQTATWTSSDESILSVDANGKVKALKAGTATITVTVDGVSATCNVVVDRWLFDDVQDESTYYFEPVYWAYYHDPQITNGVTKKLFAPDAICTRAQVVSFLWRSHGEQEPITADNPFVDVPQNQYYYKAVLWAVEEGITVGISSTQFDPEGKCTRAQVATFLWRSQGCPEPTTAVNPFKDVGSGKYYYKAVLWAVENKITNGTSATTFGPDNPCSRAQIVTFLYRDMNL